MAIKLSTKENEDFKERVLAPAGSHPARLFRIIDKGTVYKEAYDKHQRQVEFTWELPFELNAFKEGDEPTPLMVSRTFTLSLHPKSALTKVLKTWGADLSKEEFDIEDLFDMPCVVTLAHNKVESNGKTKTYVNVEGVSTPIKGMAIPEAVNKSVVFSLDDFNEDVYNSLPEFMREIIAASPEYKEATALDATATTAEDSLPF